MSSVVIKTEEIVDTNGYISEDIDEDPNFTFDDSGGEIRQHRIGYSRFDHHSKDSSHVLSSSTSISSQQAHRKEMNVSNGSEQIAAGVKSPSTKSNLDSEKRMRREIANSNERRRMQSINAGFQNLRSLLPRHEGEKLSKAAILQQTSQYICDLENQKTQLLSQNSQLKRTLGQHELALTGGYAGGTGNLDDGCSGTKKRKLTDNVISLQTISDSSDEGLGSVSPEPTTLLQGNNASGAVSLGITKSTHGTAYITHSAKEFIELKKQLEKERRARASIEEELRTIKRQLFADSYIGREVIEHTDNIREEDGSLTYLEPSEKTEHTEVIVCSTIDEIHDDCTEIVTDEHIHEEIILAQEDVKYADSTTLQPILQAAIQAQPKVEVERINEAVIKIDAEKEAQVSQKKSNSNSIGLTRSRQNLETIVEAIRHLEGDHLFGDSTGQQKKAQKSQESPLALTTKQMISCTAATIQPVPHQQQQQQQRKTIAELRPFLQLKNPKITTNVVTIVKGNSMTVNTGNAAINRGDNTNMSVSNVVTSIASTHNNSNSSSSNNTNSTIVSAMPSSNSVSTVTANSSVANSKSTSSNSIIPTNNAALPTAIVKVQTTSPLNTTSMPPTATPSHITITTASLKQCRPGVIVAKQIS